jgi:hypothetical protein
MKPDRSTVATSQRLHDTLNRLAAIEDRAFAGEFLAPVVRGGMMRVRIAGVICQFRVAPGGFEGFGVFRAASSTTARLVRMARLAERRRYLDLLPLVRLVVCGRAGSTWRAIPAQRADGRFRFEGLIPIQLAEEVRLFDVLCVRFDGHQCWYDEADPRRDPATAAYLRESLANRTVPDRLDRPGLSIEERTAYGLKYWPLIVSEEEARRDRVEERLRAALGHAGASLRDYLERDDVYRVAYDVDGRRHVSVVRKDDLSVQAAGICLSGEDGRFDLQSLVGVLREGHDDGAIVPVGFDQGGLTEEAYWDVHPPGPEP